MQDDGERGVVEGWPFRVEVGALKTLLVGFRKETPCYHTCQVVGSIKCRVRHYGAEVRNGADTDDHLDKEARPHGDRQRESCSIYGG